MAGEGAKETPVAKSVILPSKEASTPKAADLWNVFSSFRNISPAIEFLAASPNRDLPVGEAITGLLQTVGSVAGEHLSPSIRRIVESNKGILDKYGQEKVGEVLKMTLNLDKPAFRTVDDGTPGGKKVERPVMGSDLAERVASGFDFRYQQTTLPKIEAAIGTVFKK